MATDKTLFELLALLATSEYVENRIAEIAASLEPPDRAWTYTNDAGQVFLAQSKNRGEAYRSIEDQSGEYPTSDELKRCKAMDGLGFNELWGLYAGVLEVIECANPKCHNGIYIEGMAHGSRSGSLVNEWGDREPIVVGTDVFCSKGCYDRSHR